MELMVLVYKSMYAGSLNPYSSSCYHRLSTNHDPLIAQVCSINLVSYR